MAAASLVFITGGVRSGKSYFAEKMAVEHAKENGGQLTYLATGLASDSEMRERIAKHQNDRESGKSRWRTIEQSQNIGESADYFNKEDIILVDCVTTLLNNELFSSKQEWDESFLAHVIEMIITGINKLRERSQVLIVVSNEVFYESIAENDLVFSYSRILGKIHQQLVKEADQAFLVEAGIPINMKGVRK
ncbi:adenosylcobinamide kinase/adenosylcobinamide-phosphate guanylyltransferase [Neobacillus niacini]|jgi:adenosylcobinamide kinase / adenosylcobinamide-phosphate guanylyltransferase|uniref:bifunctional adenosylcobinamide kinase/adenosylcobinamide-phosphate guanylyltransferase n=1 Tax=Neobacillus niacini TaxID=86668 RepID=UPI00277ED6D0|nr:bifunctional adenosylcobinamide kinase/adenosylcobinamide-phosphate guanylyltransferase [Neobacillus niacini]MDQ1003182.1 adenosylcobinamide kinase/adenosylcobinamide-phosphate guanylyltransferase [Neobacillus niacini]